MEGKTKIARINQKSTFFISLFLFLNIQDIRKSKAPAFERGSHKIFLCQVLTSPTLKTPVRGASKTPVRVQKTPVSKSIPTSRNQEESEDSLDEGYRPEDKVLNP